MSNFTPEYIELCKNEKIQGLRDSLLRDDEHIYFYLSCELNDSGKNDYNIKYIRSVRMLFWLPTGDQLDDEIVKICGIKKVSYGYNPGLRHNASGNEYYYASIKSYIPDELGIFITNFDNPLIAKIQLLINLLEE